MGTNVFLLLLSCFLSGAIADEYVESITTETNIPITTGIKNNVTDDSNEPVYLGSDILYSSCTTIWRKCKVDGDFKHGDGKIEINNHVYQKGIVQHASDPPGKAIFPLEKKYSKFSTCIGISMLSTDSQCGTNVGDARFRVKGDNELLRDWETKGSPEDPTCFELDVTDVNELTLETDLNGSWDCDLSTWADAMVLKKKCNTDDQCAGEMSCLGGDCLFVLKDIIMASNACIGKCVFETTYYCIVEWAEGLTTHPGEKTSSQCETEYNECTKKC